MIDGALASGDPWLQGISRERLEREPHVRLNFSRAASASRLPASDAESGATPEFEPFLPFAHSGFRTPSGKAELYSQDLLAQGLDPVVAFVPPAESRNGSQKNKFPLELLARKSDNFLNSSFSNVPSVAAMEEPGLLEMHAADAEARGIGQGDRVRVFNNRGEVFLKARVDGAVQPGVVGAKLNWAKRNAGFQSINSLTSEKLSDMGNSATFYSVLVEVELIPG